MSSFGSRVKGLELGLIEETEGSLNIEECILLLLPTFGPPY